MWIEVNPDFLTLKGTDIDKSLTEATIRLDGELAQSLKKDFDMDFPVTDKISASKLEELKQLYCAEKLYQLQYIGMETIPYSINVDRDNSITDRKKLLKIGAALTLNKKS